MEIAKYKLISHLCEVEFCKITFSILWIFPSSNHEFRDTSYTSPRGDLKFSWHVSQLWISHVTWTRSDPPWCEAKIKIIKIKKIEDKKVMENHGHKKFNLIRSWKLLKLYWFHLTSNLHCFPNVSFYLTNVKPKIDNEWIFLYLVHPIIDR